MLLVARNTKGDTIIEVIICLAVIAGLLTTTFVTANRHTQSVRQSQERSEALQYVRGQIEILKKHAAKVPTPDLTGVYCLVIDAGGVISKSSPTFPGGYVYNSDPQLDNLSDYPSPCVVGTRYSLLVTQEDPAAGFDANTNPIYIIHARWDGIGTAGRQEVKIKVKVFNETP